MFSSAFLRALQCIQTEWYFRKPISNEFNGSLVDRFHLDVGGRLEGLKPDTTISACILCLDASILPKLVEIEFESKKSQNFLKIDASKHRMKADMVVSS